MAKSAGGKSAKSITKSEFFNRVAEATELKKADVAKVFDAITDLIKKELSQKGPGVLTLPGLFKLKAKRIAAQKGGKMVPNRFKPGEMTMTKDKPASVRIGARALKGLKEMVK
jgi:nucleoid DNA-binding protein